MNNMPRRGIQVMGTPWYTHDCDRCRHIGTGTVNGQQVDWYHCPGVGSVIARFGNAGPDYWSMPRSMLVQAAECGSEWAPAALKALEAYYGRP